MLLPAAIARRIPLPDTDGVGWGHSTIRAGSRPALLMSACSGASRPGLLTTTIGAIASTSSGLCHERSCEAASQPSTKNSSACGLAPRSAHSVSSVYDSPSRLTSMSDTANRGLSAVASLHISSRWRGEASAGGRCGGLPVGTNTTSSRFAHSSAASAAATWPLCMGSKVPPRTPNLMRGPRQVEDLVGWSWLVFELGGPDADGFARLRAGFLQGGVDAEPVELDLEALEAAVRVEVRALDQSLDPLAADREPPGEPFDRELIQCGPSSGELDGGRPGHGGQWRSLDGVHHRPPELVEPFARQRRHEQDALPARAGSQAASLLEVQLVDHHQVRPGAEAGREGFDLRAHGGQVGPRVRGGAIDDVSEDARALDVAQEAKSQADSARRSFEQSWDVGQHEPPLALVHHPELWVEGRERIGGHRRGGGRERLQQRRLAGVGRPDQADVGDELEVQRHRLLNSREAGLGVVRRLAARALEVHVAPAAGTSGRDHLRGPGLVEVRDQGAALVQDHGADRHLEREVGAAFPGLASAFAVLSGGSLPARAPRVLGEVRHPGRGPHDDRAAAPAVSTVGTATRYERLMPEGGRALAAVTRAQHDARSVDELPPGASPCRSFRSSDLFGVPAKSETSWGRTRPGRC